MDRTILVAQRAEEKNLSELLYKKLLGLALIQPPSDDFRKYLNGEMFIKSNPQAFFHVMHYLFCLLDPIEFKKRFYWPITDKRSEANFRANTVDYLKYINEKYKLRWGDIKSYLVVMPGGKKFINFLLDMVTFVAQEQIRLRERQLGSDLEAAKASGLNLKRMQRQNEFLKIYSSEYISSVEDQMLLLREKIIKLHKCFEELKIDTCVDKFKLLEKPFLVEMERVIHELLNQEFLPNVKAISKLEQLLYNIKDEIDRYQIKEAELKYDKEKVRIALEMTCGISQPITSNNITTLECTKINNLIIGFNYIQPFMEAAFKKREQTVGNKKFISSELQLLKNEIQEIESKITDFQMQLNLQVKKRSKQKNNIAAQVRNENYSLMSKYVCTPPIKLGTLGHRIYLRLPLLEDRHAKKFMELFNSKLSVIPWSSRKPKQSANSLDLNKSRIIDPLQLLKTINRGITRKPKAMNTSGAQWRERQSMFRNDLQDETEIKFSLEKDISYVDNSEYGKICDKGRNRNMETSPYTPLNVNDRTKITRSQLIQTINSSNGSAKVLCSRVSAVRKVKDDLHANTSPSGLLDTSVLGSKQTPKMKLNDITYEEESIFFDKPADDHATAVKILNMSTTCMLMSETTRETEAPLPIGENETYLCKSLNNQRSIQRQICNFQDDDDIFNISDSVLKDVTM